MSTGKTASSILVGRRMALVAGGALCVSLALGVAPSAAGAQSSSARRRRRRLARQSGSGHVPCASGDWECEERRRRAARSFVQEIVYPMMRWVVAGAVGIGGFVWWSSKKRRNRTMQALYPTSAPAAVSSLDVVALDLVLDPAASVAIRTELARALAQRHTAEAALGDVARALLSARAAWTHVAVRNWPMAGADQGEARYRAVLAEVRARREASAGRDAIGAGYRGDAASQRAHAPGVMLSITVLSRDELPEQGGAPAAVAEDTLLRLTNLPAERVQHADLEWLPASPDDALPASELVARHPRLVPVVP